MSEGDGDFQHSSEASLSNALTCIFCRMTAPTHLLFLDAEKERRRWVTCLWEGKNSMKNWCFRERFQFVQMLCILLWKGKREKERAWLRPCLHLLVYICLHSQGCVFHWEGMGMMTDKGRHLITVHHRQLAPWETHCSFNSEASSIIGIKGYQFRETENRPKQSQLFHSLHKPLRFIKPGNTKLKGMKETEEFFFFISRVFSTPKQAHLSFLCIKWKLPWALTSQQQCVVIRTKLNGSDYLSHVTSKSSKYAKSTFSI